MFHSWEVDLLYHSDSGIYGGSHTFASNVLTDLDGKNWFAPDHSTNSYFILSVNGGNSPIGKFVLRNPPTSWTRWTKDFTIEVSADMASWSVAATGTLPYNEDLTTICSEVPDMQVGYIKFTATSYHDVSGVGLQYFSAETECDSGDKYFSSHVQASGGSTYYIRT